MRLYNPTLSVSAKTKDEDLIATYEDEIKKLKRKKKEGEQQLSKQLYTSKQFGTTGLAYPIELINQVADSKNGIVEMSGSEPESKNILKKHLQA